MSTDEQTALRLEVDRAADPIPGTLSERGQAEHPYTGWLALIDASGSIRSGDVDARTRDRDPGESMEEQWDH